MDNVCLTEALWALSHLCKPYHLSTICSPLSNHGRLIGGSKSGWGVDNELTLLMVPLCRHKTWRQLLRGECERRGASWGGWGRKWRGTREGVVMDLIYFAECSYTWQMGFRLVPQGPAGCCRGDTVTGAMGTQWQAPCVVDCTCVNIFSKRPQLSQKCYVDNTCLCDFTNTHFSSFLLCAS